ncbi:hypothetical protein PIB30_085001 [Stylosanthes scabra]|uniref:Uncharacterized protein n=1 Tax=Stylosanthes scabra TaxID=79078 RepID=A0ABU6XSK6_9FABA|nr:hypothetical protein [Stylosanthes scabra]
MENVYAEMRYAEMLTLVPNQPPPPTSSSPSESPSPSSPSFTFVHLQPPPHHQDHRTLLPGQHRRLPPSVDLTLLSSVGAVAFPPPSIAATLLLSLTQDRTTIHRPRTLTATRLLSLFFDVSHNHYQEAAPSTSPSTLNFRSLHGTVLHYHTSSKLHRCRPQIQKPPHPPPFSLLRRCPILQP